MHPHRPIRFNLIAIRCKYFIRPYRSIIRIVVALQQDSYRFLLISAEISKRQW
jgi:hypothetical protein